MRLRTALFLAMVLALAGCGARGGANDHPYDNMPSAGSWGSG